MSTCAERGPTMVILPVRPCRGTSSPRRTTRWDIPTLSGPCRGPGRDCFKSFSCNTYGSPCKCCRQKTYGLARPFRCNTYKKQGGREGVPSSTFRGPSNSHLRSRRAPPGEPVRVTYGVRVSRGARWNDLTSSFRRHQSPPTLFLCSQLSTVNSRLSSL